MRNVIKSIQLMIIILLAIFFLGTSLNAQTKGDAKGKKEVEKIESTYKAAKHFMLKKDWQDAIDGFKQIAESFPKSQWADDSLYWLAYCQNRLSRDINDLDTLLEVQQNSLSRLETLAKYFPTSKFLDDAKILKVEIAEELVRKGFAKYEKYIVNGAAENDDVEMKLIAIDSLMNTDKEKAFPILEKIIRKNENATLRKKALFVLVQTADARVVPLLMDVAKNDKDLKVRESAIFWLGQSGNGKTIKSLLQIYDTLKDSETEIKMKEKIVFAIAQLDEQGTVKTLIDIYKKESNLSIKKKILFWLGQSKQKEAMEFIQKVIFE